MTGAPTVRKRRIGRVLRAHREKAGLTHEQVSHEIKFSTAKISRFETGHGKLIWRDIRDLLDIYNAPLDVRDRLHELVNDADEQGYWQDFEDILPQGFEMYVSLESEAAVISAFDTYLIPGLLQTTDYARTAIRAELPAAGETEIDRLVELRMARQELLTRAVVPLRLWVILDEAALRRAVGGPAVMRAQLDRLATTCRPSNVDIQVLPFGTGAHVAMSGSFRIIEFAEPTDPEVAYVDCAAGNLYVERPDEVRRLKARFSHLKTEALKPRHSVTFIRAIAKEYA